MWQGSTYFTCHSNDCMRHLYQCSLMSVIIFWAQNALCLGATAKPFSLKRIG